MDKMFRFVCCSTICHHRVFGRKFCNWPDITKKVMAFPAPILIRYKVKNIFSRQKRNVYPNTIIQRDSKRWTQFRKSVFRPELLPLHRQPIYSNWWFQRQMFFLVGG